MAFKNQPAPGVGNAVRAATDVGQAWALCGNGSRSAERTIREPIGQLRWSRAFFLWQILSQNATFFEYQTSAIFPLIVRFLSKRIAYFRVSNTRANAEA